MSIQEAIGIRAYTNALQNFSKAEQKIQSTGLAKTQSQENEFSKVLKDSLVKVNDLQSERSQMVTAFASGANQNVHELMISMQKASLAMNMTSAVRNKALEAYRELTRMQF